MKFKLIIISFLLIGCVIKESNAQEHKTIIIENVPESKVWPIVYKTFKDLKLKYPQINKQLGEGETSYFQYSTMLAKNRAKYKITYQNSILTISLFSRQYLSKSSWVDNPLPLPKKQAEKLLKPIKLKVLELLKSSEISTSNIAIATNKTQTKTAGIYNDFALVKTNDNEMDLLAIHSNGNIIGFNLSTDKKRVKSLIFKENENAQAVTMFFNDEGYPKGLVTSNFVINIESAENNTANLTINDLNGNLIENQKIELESITSFSTIIQQKNEGNGPEISPIVFVIDLKNLSKYLGYASTALQTVTCVGLIASGAGVPLAAVTCGAALVDLTVQVLPEENFLYDELELISEVSALIPTKSPLTFVKLFENLDRTDKLLVGLKRLTASSSNLLDKYFPNDKTNVKNYSEPIITSTESKQHSTTNKPATIKKAWEENENSIAEKEATYENSIVLDNTTPKKAMILLFNFFKKKEFRKAALLYAGPKGEQFTKEDIDKLEGLLAYGFEKLEKEKNGFENGTINKETINKDGKTAIVNSTVLYKNNETDTQDQTLFKINGKWYISIK